MSIYQQLRDAILEGRLSPGERLPSSRALATRLGIARNTVAAAYEELVAEGYATSRVGAGTFVAIAATPKAAAARSARDGLHIEPRQYWREPPSPFRGSVPRTQSGMAHPYDFRVGVPDGALFPAAAWRRAVMGSLQSPAGQEEAYCDPAGERSLRAAIARHVGIARSVVTTADDVIVTRGAQQAFDLIARVMIEPGDRVAVEEPGYPPARRLFESHGARVVPVPVDSEGIIVTGIPPDVRFVHTTPSHQMPLGIRMSLRRRQGLVDFALRNGVVIVEDDYDSEFRVDGHSLEPLQRLDRVGNVIYVGTFSKTLRPDLRIGFAIAPRSLQAAMRAAIELMDWHGEPVSQRALATIMENGSLGRHVARANRVYGERRAALVAAIDRHLTHFVERLPAAAGLHLGLHLRQGVEVDLAQAKATALANGAVIQTLSAYSSGDNAPRGLVLGFGAILSEQIEPGIQVVARALARASTGG